jgi:two-component sensor histidine kinase
MRFNNQWNLSIAGLILTLIGLVTLLVVPIIVGIRVEKDFDKIDRLEKAREHTDEALKIAFESRGFVLYRYTTLAIPPRYKSADDFYRKLMANWQQAMSSEAEIAPAGGKALLAWRAGKNDLNRWLTEYVSRFKDQGDYGGLGSTFQDYNQVFERSVEELRKAHAAAEDAQIEIREGQKWLQSAQITIVSPLAIICFALAFLAWMNVRTLRQAWVREQEAANHLQVAVQESNHRIKNNLQVIGALIDMQIQEEPGDSVPKDALEDIVHQVRAVAAVHDFFSHELRSDLIDGDQMLRRLVELTASPIGLRVELEAEAVELAVQQATAVALITNELLLNSGKHGATEARIVMKSDGVNACLLVNDNGPGFPPCFDVEQNANLGLSLVETLARHDLKGELLFTNQNGAQVEVTFPLASSSPQS